MSRHQSPNLEEILSQKVLDEELLEVPLSRLVFRFFLLAVFLLMALAFGRLIFLNVYRREFYNHRAFVNANQLVYQPPLRGVIFDRFNRPLTRNEAVFRILLAPAELPKNAAEREKFFQKVSTILEIGPAEIEGILRNSDFERADKLAIKKISDPQKIIALKELKSPAVQIENDYRRFYPEPEIFSHLLGYLGAVSKSDLAERSDIAANDEIGRTGLEAVYDRELRGEPGRLIKFRDVKGKFLGEKLLNPPEAGQPLVTNIDAGLQKKFYEALAKAVKRVGGFAGVGLAINPQNGEVLALVSLPSFDNNLFSGSGNAAGLAEILQDKRQPLFNRAVGGAYNPGSTIKPLVAAAALAEKLVDPQKEVFSAGFIEIPNPYHPDQPSRFLDWKPHGWVNLYSALARSSNVYFYSVGGGFENVKGLGIYRLKSYWQKFGLGTSTNIDLFGEKAGLLPAPETKRGSAWLLGDTYNVSIGQGDLLLTPIQLINFISAIGSGGYIYEPHLKKMPAKTAVDLSFYRDVFQEVERGMLDAVRKPYGTANLLNDLPFKIAAKTGSAQTANNTKVNALFVGYGPVPNPQIAVLVLVENAKEGSLNAVPVAKEVFEWYYDNRLRANK